VRAARDGGARSFLFWGGRWAAAGTAVGPTCACAVAVAQAEEAVLRGQLGTAGGADADHGGAPALLEEARL
jgi:hypothetical protein